MTRVGVIVRLLMLLTCVVPFTSTRQALGAITLRTPVAPAAPFVPVQEEEDSEREEAAGGKEKARTPPSHHPRAARTQTFHRGHARLLLTVIPSSPSPVDPFRNGLGCPFRC